MAEQDFNVAGLSPQVLQGVLKAVGVDLSTLQQINEGNKMASFFQYSEKCPEGKIFKCMPEHEKQVRKDLSGDGWVNTPAKLKNPCDNYEEVSKKVSIVPEMVHPSKVNTVDNDGITKATTENTDHEEGSQKSSTASEAIASESMENTAKVLDCIGRGMENKDVARELGIHHKTVEKIRRENT